jgi:negative regulator of flagellin synthesis FlgM
MNNIDPAASRARFFPNAKNTPAKARAKSIEPNYLPRNTDIRKKELENTTQKDAQVSIQDTVKDFARIKKAVDQATPVDNSAKIAQLKSQIKSGQYKIDYEAIADKILTSEY